MITTTLNRIRAHGPCTKGWRKLLAHLGKTEADDEPLPYAVIVEFNGLDDALWCCRAESDRKEWRLFAVWCARQVEHLMTDQRSKDALEVAERHAHENATDAELNAARAAARAAAGAAARASAEAAARASAEAATCDAAWAAAWDAAWAAAWAAAWDAQKAMFLRVVNAESEDAAVQILHTTLLVCTASPPSVL